jgi:hypothetical protein
MRKKKQKITIENFLYSLDMNMPMQDHFDNARLDSKLYDWEDDVLEEIQDGIIEAYMKKGTHNK